MAGSEGVKISVGQGLHASFLQPDGPSLPGTDWVVILSDAQHEKRVLVRVYDNGPQPPDPVVGGKAALDHVVRLVQTGWRPYQYKGLPGELVAVPAIKSADSATTKRESGLP